MTLQGAIQQLYDMRCNDKFPIYYKPAIDEVIKTIVADAQEVRRGRWIEEYSANHFQAKCSACGESTLYGITYDLEGNAYYMNYCPNCGAKMECEQNG